jgi:uncharacterized membrane protein YfcA
MDPLLLSFLLVLALSGIFSLLGLGGSSIYVPAFLWMGFPLEVAIPTGLLLNMVTSGTSAFNCRKLIDLKAVSWIMLGSLIGAPIGALLSAFLPHQIIIGIFSLVLFAGAARMLLYKTKPSKKSALAGGEASLAEGPGASLPSIAARAGAGAATGTLSGLLGIGGGLFLVPFLIESGVTPKKASIISHPVVFSASLFGLLGHLALLQNANTGLMLLTALAAFIGSFAGSWKMAHGRIDDALIKRAFTLLLLLFALKLAIDFFAFPSA